MAIVTDGRYWKINGVKKLLVGGFTGGEPFLYRQSDVVSSDGSDELTPELDILKAAGGNYIRNTMANWPNPHVLGKNIQDYPFTGGPNAYDLTSLNSSYFDRLDALLSKAWSRGIIVSIELWEPHYLGGAVWADGIYQVWNPDNTITYDSTSSGLPGGSGDAWSGFYALNKAPLIDAQKRFVDEVIRITAQHENVFIQIENESPAVLYNANWDDYWATYVNNKELGIKITSMRDNGDLTLDASSKHAMTSSLYDYGDDSQGEFGSLDDKFTKLVAFHATASKPVNSIKIYSRLTTHQLALDAFMVAIIAGNGGVAFHPGEYDPVTDGDGLGLSLMAQDAIKAGRWLDDNCDLTVMGAVAINSPDWGGHRPDTGAWACYGTHQIAIYVITEEIFTFDTLGIGDTIFETWYRIDTGQIIVRDSKQSYPFTTIRPPFGVNRALVIISGTGGSGGTEPEPEPENKPWIPPIKPIPKPWPFIPQRIHTESMEWATDVIRTKAVEERIALRSAPRYFYDYNYIMDERQFSRAKLICQDGKDVYLPIWSELTEVTSVTSGVEFLLFDTDYAHYIEGGQAIIWSGDDAFEVVTIDTVTPTGITWAGELVKTHSPAFVMPVKTCKFTSALKAKRHAKTYSETAIGFVTTETEDLSEDGGISSPAGESIPITNSGAETGDLTGWTVVSGDWLAHNAWGASPSGGYYFIPSITTSSDGVLRQNASLVVGGLTALIIDEGKSTVIITWEQDLGTPVSDDIGNIKLTFLDGASGVISSASSPSQKGSLNGWETLTFETQVPIDSRTMQIDIESQFGGDGLYNDSKWDNIRASVSQNVTIPEAETTILLDCNVLQSGTLDESYLEEMDILDYDTGDIWSDEAFRYPMRHSIFSWHNSNREQEWNVRQWLHNRRGKWGLFWLPSWNNDFEVTENILATDNFLIVKDVGYADHVDIIRYGMITTHGGARYFFRILSADNAITDGFETLTLGDAFGITLTTAEIAQASLLTLMRLSADRVEIQHNDARQSFISIPLMDPVFNGGVIGSIAGDLPAMTGAAQGWISLHASIAGTLPAITGAATATVRQYVGNAAGTLPAMTGAASGWISLHADADGTLPAITGASSGWISLHADVAGNLPAITGTASSTYTDP